MELETRLAFPAELELRQEGGRPRIRGRFPYGALATIADRGAVRKETFGEHAFTYSVEAAQASPDLDISLLSGHSFNRPLAGLRAGSLVLAARADALDFEAELPAEADQPSWVRDALLQLRAGLAGGISPGFRVPPAAAVPNAETLVPEPGNPGVQVRVIREATLFELSIVTRPAYKATSVEEARALLEASATGRAAPDLRRAFAWL